MISPRIDFLTDPGKPPGNEDAGGHACAGDALLMWVLDGATSVSDADLLGQGVSDVEWYAGAASKALAACAHERAPLGDIVSAAVAGVAAHYRDLLGGKTPADYETPIAAMVLARITPLGHGRVRVEGARLGDCCLFAGGEAGTVTALTGLHDPAGEAKMHAKVGELRRAGMTDEAAVRDANLPELRRQRAYLTRPGRPVLGLDPTVGARLILDTAELGPGAGVLAMSDGYFRGVEIYGAWTQDSLFADSRDLGLAPVMARLRAIEDAAGTLDRHPRLKRRDDATAALWRA